MKKIFGLMITFALVAILSACGTTSAKAIELMGAGDRIHDSYTFANHGTQIKDDGKNTFTVYGSVDALNNSAVKEEFEIAADVTHIVAIKLSAIGEKVVKNEVEISVNGVRNYDAEHLNATSHTFILLEAKPGATVAISVKWSASADAKNYVLYFDETLELK